MQFYGSVYFVVVFKIDGIISVRIFNEIHNAQKFIHQNGGKIEVKSIDDGKLKNTLESNKVYASVLLNCSGDVVELFIWSTDDLAQKYCKNKFNVLLFTETIDRGLNEINNNSKNNNIEINIRG